MGPADCLRQQGGHRPAGQTMDTWAALHWGGRAVVWSWYHWCCVKPGHGFCVLGPCCSGLLALQTAPGLAVQLQACPMVHSCQYDMLACCRAILLCSVTTGINGCGWLSLVAGALHARGAHHCVVCSAHAPPWVLSSSGNCNVCSQHRLCRHCTCSCCPL